MIQVQPAAAPADQRSLAQLVADIRAARQLMSAHNPHRELLEQCAVALGDVAVQLHTATKRADRQRQLVADVLVDMRAVLAECTVQADPDLGIAGLRNALDAWAEALAPIEVA